MVFDTAFGAPFGGTDAPDDEVAEVIRLLRNAPTDAWTGTTPQIRWWWADAQGERGPGADQAPILYVWSPTGSTLDRFSMDGTRYDQTDTIEVQVWSLSPYEAQQLQADITHYLGTYIDDNRTNTPYSTLEATTQEDFREQNPARQTDHYVMSVEFDARGLSVTREVEGGAFEFGFDGGFA